MTIRKVVNRQIYYHFSLFKNIRTRSYATRTAEELPLGRIPHFKRAPWFSWKASSLMFISGCLFVYYDAPFAAIRLYTNIDDTSAYNTDILPLQLEYRLKNFAVYQELAHPQKKNEWIMLKSWENLDRNSVTLLPSSAKSVSREEEYSKNSMTVSTLAKPGGILILPVTFYNPHTDACVTILHVGYKLCGYPTLVHGGMIATMFNEAFKRNASLSKNTKSRLKDDFKVEKLKINYRKPTSAGQFLVIRVQPGVSNSDPKALHLTATLESEDGKLLVNSEADLYDTGRASKNLEAAQRRQSLSWWKPW